MSWSGAAEARIVGDPAVEIGSRLRQPKGRARDALLLRAGREDRTGTSSLPRRSRRGPRRWLSSASWMLEVPQVVVPTRGRRWRRWRRGSGAIRPRSCGWSGSPGPTARRLRRSWCGRSSRRRGSSAGLLGTVQAGRRRGRGGGRADDPGGDRPAGDLPADARGRRPGLRDGGLLARAGAAPLPTRSISRWRSSRT